MIIEAYYVKCARTEEMIPGSRLITSRSHGAGGVKLSRHVGKFLRQERIDRHRGFLIGKHILPMTEIQYEIRFGKRKGISLRVAPLLKHLISDAPHYYGGMIAVAHHKISQIAFVPLREIACIVVRRLFLTPHVKRLIHHHHTHRIAKFKEFGSRRIVG